MRIQKYNFSYTQVIAVGFLITILGGSLLLSLPAASADGRSISYINALFTATSATCVTGLIVVDTYTHWSIFGQIVIISLIQIGGLGFMTVITMFSLFIKRRISIHERKLLMQSAGAMQISGVIRLIKRILLGTLIFEGLGIILLSIRFCPEMGFWEGLYNGIFHSVSAFCNAGFDIMGKYGAFSSLTKYRGDYLVNLTIASLIAIGGLGFIVWNDIVVKGFKVKEYELHTKIVLTVTGFLIFAGMILFCIFEKNYTLANLTAGEKFIASLFQSITPRTAGFNTVDMGALSDSGNMLITILMFIGGSPGSTAGGIKTTTFAVLMLGALSASRHTKHIAIYKRRLDESIVKQASAIFVIYTMAVIVASLTISAIELQSMKNVVFEVVSAIGTVGLTTGITSTLCSVSKVILIIFMYGGRVGGLTLMLSLAEKRTVTPIERPMEKILIG